MYYNYNPYRISFLKGGMDRVLPATATAATAAAATAHPSRTGFSFADYDDFGRPLHSGVTPFLNEILQASGAKGNL